MTPKQALEILIKYVQDHSCCGRVPEKEREAIMEELQNLPEGEKRENDEMGCDLKRIDYNNTLFLKTQDYLQKLTRIRFDRPWRHTEPRFRCDSIPATGPHPEGRPPAAEPLKNLL